MTSGAAVPTSGAAVPTSGAAVPTSGAVVVAWGEAMTRDAVCRRVPGARGMRGARACRGVGVPGRGSGVGVRRRGPTCRRSQSVVVTVAPGLGATQRLRWYVVVVIRVVVVAPSPSPRSVLFGPTAMVGSLAVEIQRGTLRLRARHEKQRVRQLHPIRCRCDARRFHHRHLPLLALLWPHHLALTNHVGGQHALATSAPCKADRILRGFHTDHAQRLTLPHLQPIKREVRRRCVVTASENHTTRRRDERSTSTSLLLLRLRWRGGCVTLRLRRRLTWRRWWHGVIIADASCFPGADAKERSRRFPQTVREDKEAHTLMMVFFVGKEGSTSRPANQFWVAAGNDEVKSE